MIRQLLFKALNRILQVFKYARLHTCLVCVAWRFKQFEREQLSLSQLLTALALLIAAFLLFYRPQIA